MPQARETGPSTGKNSQTWATFLHNHAAQLGTCDFLQIYDLFFRPLFIFFIMEFGARRVVHFGVMQNRTDEWTARWLQQATPYGKKPKYIIGYNDTKFGAASNRVAVVSV
jgi:putative transposase